MGGDFNILTDSGPAAVADLLPTLGGYNNYHDSFRLHKNFVDKYLCQEVHTVYKNVYIHMRWVIVDCIAQLDIEPK